MFGFARRPAPFRSPVIERQPPHDPHEPASETLPIAQLLEPDVRSCERLLRDVFCVLSVPENGKRHTERERRILNQQNVELAGQRVVYVHEPAGQPVCPLMHWSARS